ncbi:UDP-N-acetyl-D-galactosamine dehydrogenase [Balnearium lithotrophicum]|uniref:UDP-N-acetyl-D-galactosamine dehydrogenase n=1 Tax=Balnearium lithotrophicum TaxID=223788 RepID=A0A521C8G3_9BACT|nr:nucleotide sugar dehydrogenase [Balnearium lithotrophicum]SMO55729.1 UDP-N-acetyl-D-galactosamine dehydrogenase [Balnearium lithotrophicum]
MNIKSFKKGNKEKIVVVGLGYVGLPLAVLFDTKYNVIGFDINPQRVKELKESYDRTKEVEPEKLKNCQIEFTNNPEKISEAKVIIVTVPTPIDEHNIPDLRPILSATKTVGKYMKPGSIIVYESTVYPGLTEEECIPILEKESGLKWKENFNVGYSPERVNPGDKEHTIDKIQKVVAGDTPETMEFLAELYGSVITAGIHKAPNIKTAEAAKVIENTQRDLNIALMNELSVIFNKLGIDTKAVLEAAGTKWNFLKFEPGLVGGHCIGVDPYYLTFKAQAIGYHPEVVLAGRRINDYMGKFVAENTVKELIKAGKAVKGSKVLILGITFKENISDIRNTKVIDVYNELKDFGVDVYIYDPFAYPDEVKKEYGIELIENMESYAPYDAVIVAVKHKTFIDNLTLKDYKKLTKDDGKPILIDIKGIYDREKAEKEGFLYWRL